MQDAYDSDRERVMEERLEALEWALGNIDRIDDRVVRAYVVRIKKVIEEREKQLMQEEGQAIPAPSKEFQVLDGTSSEEVHVLDKTSFQEVNVLDKTSFEEVLVGL